MSDLLKKLKTAGAIVAVGGGALFAGSEVGKPACDFVLVDNQQEICLTTEQKDFLVKNLKGRNTGFGQSQFSDIEIRPK